MTKTSHSKRAHKIVYLGRSASNDGARTERETRGCVMSSRLSFRRGQVAFIGDYGQLSVIIRGFGAALNCRFRSVRYRTSAAKAASSKRVNYRQRTTTTLWVSSSRLLLTSAVSDVMSGHPALQRRWFRCLLPYLHSCCESALQNLPLFSVYITKHNQTFILMELAQACLYLPVTLPFVGGDTQKCVLNGKYKCIHIGHGNVYEFETSI